ncbi:MAG: hypothetical protein V1821_03440 [bacterium]
MGKLKKPRRIIPLRGNMQRLYTFMRSTSMTIAARGYIVGQQLPNLMTAGTKRTEDVQRIYVACMDGNPDERTFIFLEDGGAYSHLEGGEDLADYPDWITGFREMKMFFMQRVKEYKRSPRILEVLENIDIRPILIPPS